MVTVKPLSGAHPGFASLSSTAIAKVESYTKSVKVNGETINATAIKFLDANGRCFAEMNTARGDFAYIRLEDEGNKQIGSFITKADGQTLTFPAKGTLKSVPVGGMQMSKTGTPYQRHDVILSGVTFADLLANA